MKRLCLLALTLTALVASAFAQFTYTSIDFPGGDVTTTRGINNSGDIVGAYRISPPRHALLVRGGKFIPLAPTTILGSNFSEAYKTNDRGDVVGQYIGDDGASHGFLLSKKGVLTTIDFPTASDTIAYGINDSGTIVGSWDIVDSNGNLIALHGFIWNNGSFSEVNFPGSASSDVFGINARGDLVGDWSDLNSPVGHGFVYSKGQFTSINNAGQIVGNHFDTEDSFFRGFLAQPENKKKPE